MYSRIASAFPALKKHAGDSESAEASVCEEPVQASGDDILSYDQKYVGGGKGGSKGMATLKRKIPAEITPEQDEFIRKTAVDAFRYLGLNGVTRIDFMIDMATDKVYINEINLSPALWHSTSGSPRA